MKRMVTKIKESRDYLCDTVKTGSKVRVIKSLRCELFVYCTDSSNQRQNEIKRVVDILFPGPEITNVTRSNIRVISYHIIVIIMVCTASILFKGNLVTKVTGQYGLRGFLK